MPPLRHRCSPCASNWDASSERPPPPSCKIDVTRRNLREMFWSILRSGVTPTIIPCPTTRETFKLLVVNLHLENIWASHRGVCPQRSRGSASTSQTSSRNLETGSFWWYIVEPPDAGKVSLTGSQVQSCPSWGVQDLDCTESIIIIEFQIVSFVDTLPS